MVTACPTQGVQPNSQGEFSSADSPGHPETKLKEEAAPSFVAEQWHCQIPFNSSEELLDEAAIPSLDPPQNVQMWTCQQMLLGQHGNANPECLTGCCTKPVAVT